MTVTEKIIIKLEYWLNCFQLLNYHRVLIELIFPQGIASFHSIHHTVMESLHIYTYCKYPAHLRTSYQIN